MCVEAEFKHHLLYQLVLLGLAQVFFALDVAFLNHFGRKVQVLSHHFIAFDTLAHVLVVQVVNLFLYQEQVE